MCVSLFNLLSLRAHITATAPAIAAGAPDPTAAEEENNEFLRETSY